MNKACGTRINPAHQKGREKAADIIDRYFTSYNAARLREACHLLEKKIMKPDVTVGLSLTGAITPTGLGKASLIPLIRGGYIDWIVSTGANLYHDMHFALDLPLYASTPFHDDAVLRKNNIVRIYDIIFDQDVLFKTDAFVYETMKKDVFSGNLSTSELHYRLGKFLDEQEKKLGTGNVSFLAEAYRQGVPVYTSSPGDSTLGMNFAALELVEHRFTIDIARDVNETSAIVYNTQASGGESAVIILGGGSPKNFVLQTEPQIQEVLGLEEIRGHDYFIQITDARPDTGGLSGATPKEAVSWGKIQAEQISDTVVCYTDITIALPLITDYILTNVKKRKPKRLYDRRDELVNRLRQAYLERLAVKKSLAGKKAATGKASGKK